MTKDPTVKDILLTFTPEQRECLCEIIGRAVGQSKRRAPKYIRQIYETLNKDEQKMVACYVLQGIIDFYKEAEQ